MVLYDEGRAVPKALQFVDSVLRGESKLKLNIVSTRWLTSTTSCAPSSGKEVEYSLIHNFQASSRSQLLVHSGGYH